MIDILAYIENYYNNISCKWLKCIAYSKISKSRTYIFAVNGDKKKEIKCPTILNIIKNILKQKKHENVDQALISTTTIDSMAFLDYHTLNFNDHLNYLRLIISLKLYRPEIFDITWFIPKNYLLSKPGKYTELKTIPGPQACLQKKYGDFYYENRTWNCAERKIFNYQTYKDYYSKVYVNMPPCQFCLAGLPFRTKLYFLNKDYEDSLFRLTRISADHFKIIRKKM